MSLPHSPRCTCLACQVTHCEPQLVFRVYQRATRWVVVDSVELVEAGYWIVNYRVIGASESGWMLVEDWNKQCSKPVETA